MKLFINALTVFSVCIFGISSAYAANVYCPSKVICTGNTPETCIPSGGTANIWNYSEATKNMAGEFVLTQVLHDNLLGTTLCWFSQNGQAILKYKSNVSLKPDKTVKPNKWQNNRRCATGKPNQPTAIDPQLCPLIKD